MTLAKMAELDTIEVRARAGMFFKIFSETIPNFTENFTA